MNITIVCQEEEKIIKIRKKLIINNLIAIINKEMKPKNKCMSLMHKGLEL